jgi:hypothetical protein
MPPESSVNGTTPSLGRIGDPVPQNFTTPLNVSGLKTGTNVIAVEVHQESEITSDSAFALKMNLTVWGPSSTRSITASKSVSSSVSMTQTALPVGPEQIRFSEVWKYNDAGLDLGTAWVSPSFSDKTWAFGRGSLGTNLVSCRVVSCRVVSCRVVSCRVVSCRVVSCRVVSCCAALITHQAGEKTTPSRASASETTPCCGLSRRTSARRSRLRAFH